MKKETQKQANSQTYVHTETFFSEWDYYYRRDPVTVVFTFLANDGAATWHEFRLPFNAVSAAFSTNGRATDALLFLRRSRRSSPLFWGRADVASSAVPVPGFSELLARISAAAVQAASAECYSSVTFHVTVHTVSLDKPGPDGRPAWRPSADVSLECQVCQRGFKGEVTWLPCWHGFHRDCVHSSLKRNHSCPTCHLPVFPTSLPLKDAINIFYKSSN